MSRLSLVERSTWQERSPMLTPSTDQGSLVYKGKIYIFGGLRETLTSHMSQVLNTVECYCPLLNEWHYLPPMLERRKEPRGVVAINNEIYIVDGIDHDPDSEDDERLTQSHPAQRCYAEKYNPAHQTWQRLPQR